MTERPDSYEIIVLISADEEWKVVKETIPSPELKPSPFGEWFAHELVTQGRRVAVVFFQTGCGKMPAAAATQFVLNKWNPQLVINLGTCGGFKGKVETGDILLVTKTVVYDIVVRTEQHDEQIAKYTTDLDLSWLGKPYPVNAFPATMATADQDLDPKRISDLYEKHGAVAADWESGAIAYVAHKMNKTKCLIVRGVSDVVDPPSGEPSSEEEITEGTKIVMVKLIDSLPEWIAKVASESMTGQTKMEKKGSTMKKVTLILPDKIQHVIGSSRTRRVESQNLRSANIIKALCDRDDYHQYFYFESPNDVKVVSIVDYDEEHGKR